MYTTVVHVEIDSVIFTFSVKTCQKKQVCPDQKSYLKYNFEDDITGQGLWLDATALLIHVVIGSMLLYYLEFDRLRFHMYKSGIKEPKIPGPQYRHSIDKQSIYEGAKQLRTSLVES